MKKNNLIGAIMILVAIGLLVFLFFRYRIAPENPIKEIQLIAQKNSFDSLMGPTGKPKILSFYASWCGDCLGEMREWSEWKDGKITREFEIILVSDKKNEANESLKLRFPLLSNYFTTQEDLSKYSIYSYPTNYVFDKEGKLLWKMAGSLNTNMLEDVINQTKTTNHP